MRREWAVDQSAASDLPDKGTLYLFGLVCREESVEYGWRDHEALVDGVFEGSAKVLRLINTNAAMTLHP